MAVDLSKELDEYSQIRDWLRGKKPAPAGRTWRRTVVAAATLPLLAPVRTVALTTAILGGDVLGYLPGVGFWLMLTISGPLASLVLSFVDGAAIGNPSLPVEIFQGLSVSKGMGNVIAFILGIVGTLGGCVSLLVNGR